MKTKRKFKTKKVLSGVRTEYRGWDYWEEGDVLIGKLIGSKPNKYGQDKKDWIVEVLEVMFESKKDQKKILKAGRITLNSAGMLDKGMEQLEVGDIFQVTYNGQNTIEGGKFKGKMAHAMEVEQLVEMDDLADEEEDLEYDEDEDEDEDDDYDDEDEDEEDDY